MPECAPTDRPLRSPAHPLAGLGVATTRKLGSFDDLTSRGTGYAKPECRSVSLGVKVDKKTKHCAAGAILLLGSLGAQAADRPAGAMQTGSVAAMAPAVGVRQQGIASAGAVAPATVLARQGAVVQRRPAHPIVRAVLAAIVHATPNTGTRGTHGGDHRPGHDR